MSRLSELEWCWSGWVDWVEADERGAELNDAGWHIHGLQPCVRANYVGTRGDETKSWAAFLSPGIIVTYTCESTAEFIHSCLPVKLSSFHIRYVIRLHTCMFSTSTCLSLTWQTLYRAIYSNISLSYTCEACFFAEAQSQLETEAKFLIKFQNCLFPIIMILWVISLPGWIKARALIHCKKRTPPWLVESGKHHDCLFVIMNLDSLLLCEMKLIQRWKAAPSNICYPLILARVLLFIMSFSLGDERALMYGSQSYILLSLLKFFQSSHTRLLLLSSSWLVILKVKQLSFNLVSHQDTVQHYIIVPTPIALCYVDSMSILVKKINLFDLFIWVCLFSPWCRRREVILYQALYSATWPKKHYFAYIHHLIWSIASAEIIVSCVDALVVTMVTRPR